MTPGLRHILPGRAGVTADTWVTLADRRDPPVAQRCRIVTALAVRVATQRARSGLRSSPVKAGFTVTGDGRWRKDLRMNADADRDPTDWDSGEPLTRTEGTGKLSGNAIQFRWWNLVLLIPLLMLITALYNSDEPRVLGMPVFYWVQFLFVFVGVACVGLVFATTRGKDARGAGGPSADGGTDNGQDVQR
jgi:Protein of unknown function (DUF3311)